MIATADQTAPMPKSRLWETVVDFSPEQIKAPFLLRCGALLADYVILVSIPVITLLISRYMGNDGAKLLNDELYSAGWIIAILLGLANFVLLPMLAGQTIGKMLTGIRIVGSDGTPAAASRIALRQTLGYVITAISLGLGFLLSIFSGKGRALHDYLAGTLVIYADKRSR
ncbi:MAG: RDD family protein [Pyrinomonadaceae bacterium]